MAQVTISWLTFNGLPWIRETLPLLVRHTTGARIIATDNASTDGSREWLQSYHVREGGFELVLNERNVGFGVAHNATFAHSDGEYFVVLNDDVWVSPGWLPRLIQCFRRPEIAIVGLAGECCSLTPDGGGYPGPNLEYISGSCLAIRRTIPPLIGGLFSPEYRHVYCEDSDLGLRAREAGHQIALAQLPVSHRGQRRNGHTLDIEGYRQRNLLVLRHKWRLYLAERRFRPEWKLVRLNRTGAIGDVLLLTPILRAIRHKYPSVRIALSTRCPEVVAGNDDLAWCYPHPGMGSGPWDADVDLDGAYERAPHQHIIQAYANAVGVRQFEWRLHFEVPTDLRGWAADQLPGERWAVLHPRIIGQPGRSWPIERWGALAAWLRAEGYRIAVVGDASSPWRLMGGECDLRSATTLGQLAAAIQRAELFVGVDAAPMHLAQALGIPTVGLFGSALPEYRLLPHPWLRGVQAEGVGCLGCQHDLPPPVYLPRCYRPREYCMERLEVEQVKRAIEAVLLAATIPDASQVEGGEYAKERESEVVGVR